MNIAVVLGYQLKENSVMDNLLIERLELLIKLTSEQDIDKIIVSGGKPNKSQIYSEAFVMKNYLIERGIESDKIIMEDESNSTLQNAINSVKIAKELKAKKIIVVSTIEHFTKYSFNPVKMFSEAINDDNINLMIYTNTIPCF